MVKNLPANAGDTGSIPGSGRPPGGGHVNPFQYFCPENATDMAVYSPQGHKELDTTERLGDALRHAYNTPRKTITKTIPSRRIRNHNTATG